jgi:hypothetical protein
MAQLTQQRALKPTLQLNRAQILSIIFFAGGLLIFLLATWKVAPDDVSGFTQFGKDEPLVDLPSRATLWALGAFCMFAAAYQWVRGTKGIGMVAGLVGLFAISSLLVWATRGSSLSLFAMLRESIVRATPLILGALSGLWCERSGVINIAIEGMIGRASRRALDQIHGGPDYQRHGHQHPSGGWHPLPEHTAADPFG